MALAIITSTPDCTLMCDACGKEIPPGGVAFYSESPGKYYGNCRNPECTRTYRKGDPSFITGLGMHLFVVKQEVACPAHT